MPPTIRLAQLRRRAAILISTLTLFLTSASLPTHAQQLPPVAPVRRPVVNLLDRLNTLNYDTSQYVPLVVVNPLRWFPAETTLPDHPISLATLSEATHLRILSTGRLNTLVPPTMTQINASPGKANPFEGMRRDELLRLLLSSLTAAQWQVTGSQDGIGLGDLDENQRSLWADILPDQMTVGKYTLKPGDQPNSWAYVDPRNTPITDMSTVRIRISKQTNFALIKKGSDDTAYFANPYMFDQAEGQTILTVSIPELPKIADGRSAYGVVLLTDVPNTEKPGDIDSASPSLNVEVNLHFDPKPVPPVALGQTPIPDYGNSTLPTVGDLIARINDATRLRFVADRRVRDLTVYLRGDEARAGDLLRALARSVCGTFRTIPPSGKGEEALYLLTSDREGIGSRVAHIVEWGEDAYRVKNDMEAKVDAKTAQQNPLSALHFTSGDKFALSQAQAESDEDGWRKQEYAQAPLVSWDDLTPALKQSIQKFRQSNSSAANLSTDRVRLGEELCAYLIVPGVGEIKCDELGQSIGSQYIERIAYDPSKALAPAKPAPKKPASVPPSPFVWPAKLARRVLVASATTPEEAAALAKSAGARGFTDLWLHVSLADSEAAARILAAGVQAGTTDHIAVGATVALMRDGGLPGDPDLNLLGENGAQFGARAFQHLIATDTSNNAEFRPYFERAMKRYENWTVPPDAESLAKRLVPIAAVPGLAGLTLRNTAGPGWLDKSEGGDDIFTNGHLGYSLATRRAFLMDYGIDPLDIPEQSYAIQNIRWNLGYFAENDGQGDDIFENGQVVARPASAIPHRAWEQFRAQTDRKLLAGVYMDLQKAHPALPLYMDDRLTPYTEPTHSWFGSWDAADRLPENPPFRADSEVFAAARSHSKTLIAMWGDQWLRRVGTPDDNPVYFASRLTIVSNANLPPRWDGVAVDLQALPPADVLRLLTGLPPVFAGGKAR